MVKKSASLNASHWGVFRVGSDGKGGLFVEPHPADPEPSLLLDSIPGGVRHESRVAAPAIRKGWLEEPSHPAKRDGTDEYVQVSWGTALDALAAKLDEVRVQEGNQAIFGGSYGWGSAGRFHHAQSQIHRFLNCIGGYTFSVNSYSVGTAQVLLPHVVADIGEILRRATSWPIIARETELFLLFGGMAEKNLSVAAGGVSRHKVKSYLRAAKDRGAEFHLISPQRSDLMQECEAEWYPVHPGTDTAIMLALAFELVKSGRADESFLDRYCTGYERLRDYVLGRTDGVEKNPRWAATRTGIDAKRIERLAGRLPEKRTLINISWSLQRAPHGEQPLWMGIALSAILGQIGLPGGGFSHAYGASDEIGRPLTRLPLPTLPQGTNPVETFIPVARFSDMLLNPGGECEYNGQRLPYPRISLVYWAGGNPFHHQQDLFKLERALRRVETIVVHEPFWTAMARRADIVLPTTVTVERNDIFAARNDPNLVAMKKAIQPFGKALSDYNIFSKLAARMGVANAFTEGRGEMEWLEHLYESWRASCGHGNAIPNFAAFWDRGELEFSPKQEEYVMLSAFRDDPEANPLPTPSGRIEIYSETIAGFGYDDCPGHPVWFEPAYRHALEQGAGKKFLLIANNPGTRLHSQLDVGRVSQQSKVRGREPARISPPDAAALAVEDGDILLVWNEVGACLAGARVDDDVAPGIVQLATGAWFDGMELPAVGRACIHGNPNVLIPDRGTSRLSQGPSAQYAVVSVRKWDQAVPEKRVDRAPALGYLETEEAGG